MATLLSYPPSTHLLRKVPNPSPRNLHSLSVTFPLRPSRTRPSLALSASLLSPPPPLLATSTRTITSLLSLLLSFSRSPAASISSATSSSAPLFASTSTLFFARARTNYVSTPISVLAAGMARWLEIYNGVLLVRVLLSWFPNIPWDRQPLSAIRDLCDPYLSLFRNIIPPVFGTLDVSPLFAFFTLNFLRKILAGAAY